MCENNRMQVASEESDLKDRTQVSLLGLKDSKLTK